MTELSTSKPNIRLFKLLRVYCVASAATGVVIGCLVLCGWAFLAEFLKSVLPGLVAMRANTALCLAFSGASLWMLLPEETRFLRRQIARFVALLVTLLGAASLSESLFDVNLRIDRLLFTGPTGTAAASLADRMAPTTATAFVTIGLALLLLDSRTDSENRTSQLLSLSATLVAMIAINGYIYHAVALYKIALYTQVALHTSITIFLLSGAVFFARPRTGIAGDLTSEGSGSVMARRFLPAVFCVPILLGWIRLQRQLAGMRGLELGLALYATANVVAISLLVWLNARKMNVEYIQRGTSETAIRKLNEDLEERVAERTQALELQTTVLAQQAALLDLAHDAIIVRDMDRQIVFWSRGAESMYGWPAKLAVGKFGFELLKTEFSEPIEAIESRLLEQGYWEGETIQVKRDGLRLSVATRWALQRAADGAPVRILIINSDITDRKRTEHALRESNQKFQQLVENVTDAFWIRSPDMSEVHYVSPAFERIWGRSVESLYANPEEWLSFILPEDRERARGAFAALTADTQSVDIEYRIVRPDGNVRWVRVRGFQVRDASDELIRLSGIVSDITERKQAENALFLEKERAQVTLNCIGEGVICTDISGNITFLNLVAEKMTGWSHQEAAGRSLADVFRILDGTSRETIPNPLGRVFGKDPSAHLRSNRILIRRDGFDIPIEDSIAPIDDREGRATGAVIVFRDVSATRAMALQMTHTAQHDFLTGLPNRTLLNDRVNQAIVFASRLKKRVAVLFLDLDGFKHINDSLGHPIGDKVLQSIAQRLVTCIRATDTVSRQGGDEFVVLLSEVEHSEDAAITARRMLHAVAEAHSIDQRDLHVTASIGVSVFPDDGLDAETLTIKNADTAMYQAKENGRQSYQFFKQAMNVRAVERQSIEEDLRRALERREFTLHYQPKINIRTGEITGAEALIRWTHPIRGPVPPGQFISVAEDCGLIVPIGKWVLREACRQAREWLDARLPPATVAVNISAMEFRQDDFLEDVFEILKDTGLDPSIS